MAVSGWGPLPWNPKFPPVRTIEVSEETKSWTAADELRRPTELQIREMLSCDIESLSVEDWGQPGMRVGPSIKPTVVSEDFILALRNGGVSARTIRGLHRHNNWVRAGCPARFNWLQRFWLWLTS